MKRAPKYLSWEAKDWWKLIVYEYEIQDSPGLLILQTSLESFDRMRNAQKIIADEGDSVTDRFGQIKAHPMTAVERDCRAQILQGLKSLNLDLEPLRDIGRPPGK